MSGLDTEPGATVFQVFAYAPGDGRLVQLSIRGKS